MVRLRGTLPLVKTKKDMAAISSYYSKVFVTRCDNNSNNYSKWIIKLIIKASTTSSIISDVVYGISKSNIDTIPRAYSAIAITIDRFLLTTPSDQYQLFFNYPKITDRFTKAEISHLAEFELVPCGKTLDGKAYLGMAPNGVICLLNSRDAKGPIDAHLYQLGTLPYLINPDGDDGAIEFTELSLLNKRLPVGIALAYIYGLDGMLEKLNIKHTIVPSSTRVPYEPFQLKLKFKDVLYLFNGLSQEHRLLIGGFYAIRKDISRYRGSDFNGQMAYGSLLTELGISQYHFRELKLMVDMFVDPITEAILKEGNLPTTFIELVLRASAMLVSDYIPDYTSVRYKGYERLCGMMYSEIINAMRAHRSQGALSNVGVTISPNAVYLKILQDPSITIVEESNPIHQLKEQAIFTHLGAGGRSAITMVAETRVYNDSDLGTISEATQDSAKVAISAYTTANPNFVDLRGTTRPYDSKTDGPASVVSSSALLAPMVTHDDAKRVNYTDIQNSSTVASIGARPLPYSTGYDEVVANRVNTLFITKATMDGVVKSVNDKYVTVLYKDGEDAVYPLGVTHGTVPYGRVPHTSKSNFKAGETFKAGDVLVYVSDFFTPSILNPGLVTYKAGIVERVAIIDSMETTEDGSVLSERLVKKLSTPTTKLFGLVINFDSTIYNLVNIGDKVQPDTIICTIENSIGSTTETRHLSDVQALTALAANTPMAMVSGTISRIEVLYYGKIEDMSESLQNLVLKYDNIRSKHLSKIKSTSARSGMLSESVRVNGKKVLPNQVAIKVYIDSLITMGDGDKVVFGNMLKTTCARVESHRIVTEDGNEVDAYFGGGPIAQRIVCSPEGAGVMNTNMIVLSKQFGDMLISLT